MRFQSLHHLLAFSGPRLHSRPEGGPAPEKPRRIQLQPSCGALPSGQSGCCFWQGSNSHPLPGNCQCLLRLQEEKETCFVDNTVWDSPDPQGLKLLLLLWI